MDSTLLSADPESVAEVVRAIGDTDNWDVGRVAVDTVTFPGVDVVSDDTGCPPSSFSSLPQTRFEPDCKFEIESTHVEYII